MKYLLALLLLTVAPDLDAQQRVALTNVVWAPVENDFILAAYEDGECAELTAGFKDKMWYVAYELPDHAAPDSVTFLVSANCEFYLFSGWSHNNQNTLGYSKNTSGAITVAYKSWPGKRDYCVGVAVSGLTREGDVQSGTVCVDAAYAWYPTATVKEELRDRLLNVFQVKWYYANSIDNPQEAFYGTTKELLVSGLRGIFFSILGKYLILD